MVMDGKTVSHIQEASCTYPFIYSAFFPLSFQTRNRTDSKPFVLFVLFVLFAGSFPFPFSSPPIFFGEGTSKR